MNSVIFTADPSFPVDPLAQVVKSETLAVPRSKSVEGTKRECGEVYPTGANTTAAPATVSGEAFALECHWTFGN